MELEEVRQLLIDAQNDLLRMIDNAKNKKIEVAFGDKPNQDYNVGFYAGCIKSLEYSCKHLTNILEKTE